MSDQTTCWACEKETDANLDTCTHCSMPLTAKEEETDLDFLDDLVSSSDPETTTEEADDFVLPDMDYISGTAETSTTTATDTDQEPVLPDFDYVEGKTDATSTPLSDIDQESSITKTEDDSSSMLSEMDDILADTTEMTTEEVSEELIPDLPDFDEGIGVDKEVEEEVIEELKYTTLFDLGLKRIVFLLSKQWIYWTILYFTITIASFSLLTPNFNPQDLKAIDYVIKPDAFIFGWLSFIPMGWYFSYSLRKSNISPSWRYGAIFIIGQLLTMYLVSFIAKLVLSPSMVIGSYNKANGYFLTIYSFVPLIYLITGITAGFVIFYLFYSVYWDKVYMITPLSKIDDSLIKIGKMQQVETTNPE